MAIKVGGITVINDFRALTNVTDFTGVYTDFHPYMSTLGTVLDFNYPMYKKVLSAATTFSIINPAIGKSSIVMLDTSASLFVPTLPANIAFPVTPTWADHRYWLISFMCYSNTVVRATAIGYDTVPNPADLAPSFTLPYWDITQDYTAPSGGSVSASVEFINDPTNNRIIARAVKGNGSGLTTDDTYIDTTNLTNITSVQAQYNVQSQSCTGNCSAGGYTYGPLPTSDGYNSGVYYNAPVKFGWQSKVLSGATSDTIVQFALNSADPDFRIKVVSDEGTSYSTCEFSSGVGTLAARASDREPATGYYDNTTSPSAEWLCYVSPSSNTYSALRIMWNGTEVYYEQFPLSGSGYAEGLNNRVVGGDVYYKAAAAGGYSYTNRYGAWRNG